MDVLSALLPIAGISTARLNTNLCMERYITGSL